MNKKDSQKLKEKEFNPNLDKETVKKVMTPMNDFIFKKLFGTVGKEKLIKDFLEAILDIKIEEVELGLETILIADEIDEKAGILDVRVKLEDGTDIDVEIQNSVNSAIIKRSHFYASRMYGKQLNVGIDYGDLKKVIVIFITNFDIFPKLKEYHTRWLMTEQSNKEEHFEEMELHFIEMPKFLSTKYDKKRKIDQWLLFLKYSHKEMMKEIMKENENIKEAKEELEKLQQDEHLQYLAWLREKYVLETNTMKNEGIRIGKEQGRFEGKKENQKEIVKKMLRKGLEISLIEEITGLNKEEIEKIKEELK